MISVAWVLLSSVAWCLASPLAPGPVALETPASAHNAPGSDIAVAPQEKRLLKYFSSSWMPTQQEGSKRAYSRNYLRFGRSEEDKRAGRNFLRFGRGDSSSVEDTDLLPETEDSIEKRNRNFLRFGRNRNFLRFGRSDAEEFALPGGPLSFPSASNVQEDDLESYPMEEKRAGHRNYLRFGRGNRNFLRFGRDGSRNFLRFGRSVDRQLNEEKAGDAPLTPTTGPLSPAMTQESHRTKRAASPYNYGPAVWSQDFQPEQEGEDLQEAIDGPEMTKRAYNKSFLRFGRDRNFLRFGKRNDDDDASDMIMMDNADTFPRYVRTTKGNFLRFG